MKKILKITVVLCVFLLSVFCLASCDYLDDMKEMRVDRNDDFGNEITYQGKKYKFLEIENLGIEMGNTKEVIFVQSDVPNLLVDIFGESGQISENGELIVLEFSRYYVLEEKYEKYASMASTDSLNRYRIAIERYNREEGELEQIIKVFDEDVCKVIENTIKNGESKNDINFGEGWNYLSLDRCDETGTFYIGSEIELARHKEDGLYAANLYGGTFNSTYFFNENDSKVIDDIFEWYYKTIEDNSIYFSEYYGEDSFDSPIPDSSI